ncbi:MAG: RHS repeat-associated core domain-containing protein, partial [Anaerolineaceae bacterium]|nr:RHS repeat-associated core domain-containing protein [Anaerolineaceae bacterium]
GTALTFTWDDNGQMLTKGTQTFAWDNLGRMTGLTNGGTTASYTYNGDGVRVGRTLNGGSTAYLQDLAGGMPVVLRETTGGSSTDYVYGADLLESIAAGLPTFYHSDGLGSTRLLTDGGGTLTDRNVYDAFGAERSHSGSSRQPFTYAGEQADPEAGLIFLRARYYDPATGRFISRDSFPGFSMNPITLNHYIYASDNPVNQTDPLGLFSGSSFFSKIIQWVKNMMGVSQQNQSIVINNPNHEVDNVSVFSEHIVERRVSDIFDRNVINPENYKDCVWFVRDVRGSVPYGFNSRDFYSGDYRGKSGTLSDGSKYGQQPRLDAIMVESLNPMAEIFSGHASYVYEIFYYRDSGKVIEFTIAEAAFGDGYSKFIYDEKSNQFTSESGIRSPDMFIY